MALPKTFSEGKYDEMVGKIQEKTGKAKEDIKKEHTSQDDNVNEYLKLSSKADKQAAIRIKQVFEKKNEKSAKNIGRQYLLGHAG